MKLMHQEEYKLNQWYIPISKCLTRYSYCL